VVLYQVPVEIALSPAEAVVLHYATIIALRDRHDDLALIASRSRFGFGAVHGHGERLAFGRQDYSPGVDGQRGQVRGAGHHPNAVLSLHN